MTLGPVRAGLTAGLPLPIYSAAGGRLDVLSREECLVLLATASVGRLGVTIRALPAVLPVNFALLREQIVIRTVPGTKLDAAVAQWVVAFEADNYHPQGEWGWSVLVRGRATEITHPAELGEAAALPLQAWAFEGGAASRLLRIETMLVSGRRFGYPGGSETP